MISKLSNQSQVGLFSMMVALILFFTGCQGGEENGTATVRLSFDLSSSKTGIAKTSSAPAPTDIRSIQINATGPGMGPLSTSVEVNSEEETVVDLEIPAGPARRFIVIAFDAEQVERFRGEATVDLEPGTSPDITINMVAINVVVPPPPFNIVITPRAAVVAKGGEQIFSVIGANPADVEWRVNSQAGGNPAVGSISETGTYTAPTTIPTDANIAEPDTPLFGNPIPVTVTAAGRTNPPVEDSATVTVVTGQTLTFGTNQPVTKTPGFISTESSGQRSIAFYQGRVYIVWSENIQETNTVLFTESADETNWSSPVPVLASRSNQVEPSLAIGPDGSVYVAFVECPFCPSPNPTIKLAIRPPGEKKFAPLLPTMVGLSPQNPAVAVSPDGIIYVAWADTSRTTGFDIWLQRSPFDQNKPQKVNTDNLPNIDQMQPAISIGSSGDVFLAWEDQRDNGADIFATVLLQGVTSPLPEVRINDLGIPFSSPQITLAAGPAGTIYAAWADDNDGDESTFVFFDTGKIGSTQLEFGKDRPVGTAALNSGNQSTPSIAWDGADGIYIALHETLSGFVKDGIFLAKSRDGGGSFVFSKIDDDTSSTFSNKFSPSLAVDTAGRAFAIWTDGRLGQNQFFDVFFAKGE